MTKLAAHGVHRRGPFSNMSRSSILGLPYIASAQAQKHVTHNEALTALDAIIHIGAISRTLVDPPTDPSEGDRYIVANGGAGPWMGRDGDIAAFQDGSWQFYPPNAGWLAWVLDEEVLIAFDGAAWSAVSGGPSSGSDGGSLNPVALVGVNATADDLNRLAVASPASLFNHDGAGHQLKLNKAQSGDTASVLFQTGFSGRAEFGTVSDDNFHVKVSADGAVWTEPLIVDASTGVAQVLTPIQRVIGGDGGVLGELAGSETVTDNNVTWRTIVNRNRFSGTGLAGEDYSNEVIAMGWNLSETVSVPEDPSQAAFWDAWEFKFNIDDISYHIERHIELTDTSGVRHRVWSLSAPHSGSTGSGLVQALDRVVWAEYDAKDGLPTKVHVEWQFENEVAFFGNTANGTGFTLNFVKNDTVPLRQRNAADTAFVPLPYIDGQDRLVLTGRQQVNAGPVPAGESGISYTWNPEALNAGVTLLSVGASQQTNKSILAAVFDGDVNFNFDVLLRNRNPSGTSKQHIICDGWAVYAADDYTNGAAWSWGKNNSGHFFLGEDPFGSNDTLRIDKVRRAVEYQRPPRLPSYTVSSVPSAQVFGAGSLIFLSDESGGPVTAFSDGDQWRRTTDNAVIS